jgi:hypothetical protein
LIAFYQYIFLIILFFFACYLSNYFLTIAYQIPEFPIGQGEKKECSTCLNGYPDPKNRNLYVA